MMELLGHRNSSDVGGSLVQGSLELGDGPGVDNTQNYGSKIGGLELDMTPERLREEGMKQREVGALEVFHPGEAEDEQDSSMVVAEALRCQVKITTRRSLHLRIANHTRRDVYVRLVGNGGRIAGFSTGPQRNILEESKPSGKGHCVKFLLAPNKCIL